ncbi:hypothetical protein AAUPMB_01994, partial [Pasteurella multocida subsp. multocida str. Anand1_buffalo]
FSRTINAGFEGFNAKTDIPVEITIFNLDIRQVADNLFCTGGFNSVDSVLNKLFKLFLVNLTFLPAPTTKTRSAL